MPKPRRSSSWKHRQPAAGQAGKPFQPMPDADASPDFAMICTDAIFLARTDAMARGEVLTKKGIEKIIREQFAFWMARSTPKSATPEPFGNRRRIPPTPEQVTAYSAKIEYPMDGAKWCDFYAAKGWQVGKSRMKDWQAAVRNWRTSGWGQGTIALGKAPAAVDSTNGYTKF